MGHGAGEGLGTDLYSPSEQNPAPRGKFQERVHAPPPMSGGAVGSTRPVCDGMVSIGMNPVHPSFIKGSLVGVRVDA